MNEWMEERKAGCVLLEKSEFLLMWCVLCCMYICIYVKDNGDDDNNEEVIGLDWEVGFGGVSEWEARIRYCFALLSFSVFLNSVG